VTDKSGLPSDVERALMDRVLREAGTAVLGHSALLVIVISLVWGALPTTVLAAWAIAILSATFARLLLWRRARILQVPPRTALRTVQMTMIVLGLAWSLGTAVAVRYLPLATTILILMGLAGLLAGAVASLAAERWVFKLYVAALFGPALVGIWLGGAHRPENATLVLVVVFAAFMWREHERAYRTLLEGLRTEQRLRDRERELQTALAEVTTLQGLIRICATCKRVLTDEGSWEQFESYVRGHSDVEFSHGICPECAATWAAGV
jgi:hypothetical protein